MKKKDFFWMAILLLLFILCSLLWISWGNKTGSYAVIRQGEHEIYRLPLAVTKELTVECEKGVNTIQISPNGIMVTEASCPDKLCQKQGLVNKTNTPIVCLPHQLTVTIEGGSHEN